MKQLPAFLKRCRDQTITHNHHRETDIEAVAHPNAEHVWRMKRVIAALLLFSAPAGSGIKHRSSSGNSSGSVTESGRPGRTSRQFTNKHGGGTAT